jgi:acetyltransferase
LKKCDPNVSNITLPVKTDTAMSYPAHLITQNTLRDGTALTIRPIRPADMDLEKAFVKKLSDYSRYYRFMHPIRELSPAMLEDFTHPDYDREMALIALVTPRGTEEEIGVARYVKYPDGRQCEFALAVADAWHGKGVGTALMQELIANARLVGLESMEGFVLSTNQPMLKLVKFLGFSVEISSDDPTQMTVRKDLSAPL